MATVIKILGINGISGYPLGVEVAIIAGLQVTNIVGLGDIADKEAKDRVGMFFFLTPMMFFSSTVLTFCCDAL